MKDVLNRIRLFIGNVWMILAVDPLHKFIFSFLCAVFSLFAAEVMRNAFTKVLNDLGGIKYIDKSNMLQVCTSPVTVILILLFLLIMTYTALFYQYFEEDRSLAGITPHMFRTEEFSHTKRAAVAVDNDDSPFAEEIRSSIREAFQSAECVSARGIISCNPVLAALETAVM